MKYFFPALVLLGSGFCIQQSHAAEAQLPASWQSFKDAKDRSPAEILPDFSYAGYAHGEKGIPDVTGPVFKVTDYGAVANDLISDELAIRKTVAAAEKAGGGVVLFPAGEFLVWTDRAKVEAIRIQTPGVVIRGAGSSKGGTVIRAIHSGYRQGPYKVPKTGPEFAAIPYIFIFEEAGLGKSDDESGAGGESKKKAKSYQVTGEIKRSDFQVPVQSSKGLRAGDWVSLKAKTLKLNTELLAGLTPDPKWTRVIEGIDINENHQIREVKGNTLFLKEPVLLNLGADFGVQVIPSPKIKQVGVDDIAFQGGWRADFVHHRSALDDEGWDGILFDGVADGWVRRCSFLNLNSGVYLKNSSACSILENRIAGTPAHYNIASRSDTSFVLLGLSEDQAGQLHGVSTGNRSAGITVWRWKLKQNQSVDSHGNQPYATLIDRVDGGTMTKSGGPTAAFPNHLRWLVFWNFQYDANDNTPVNFWETDKGGVAKFVKPLFVGLHGKKLSFQQESVQANESPGSPVTPESLYEAQLELRLGKLPAWVDATRKEWAKIRVRELPFCGVPEIPAKDVYEEIFLLADLLTDLQGLMGKQELGWAVPLEIEAGATPLTIRRDYVLMRTVLHQMCTYAVPVPRKNKDDGTLTPAPPMKIKVVSDMRRIVIEMPVSSSPKDQEENKDALLIAKQLAPACQATLEIQPRGMRLTLRR